MKDILGKEIVGFNEALYLKNIGFNGACTGYYHCDDYYESYSEEDRYECVGWRGLFRNSFSKYRAAAPSIKAAKLWYAKNKVKSFTETPNLLHNEMEDIIELFTERYPQEDIPQEIAEVVADYFWEML